MSLSANVNEKAALIWAIADKLTGVYKPHEYGEVILPLTVIRRFDCILADTKDAVLAKYEEVKKLPMKDVLLRNVSGKAFYNTSKFTFETERVNVDDKVLLEYYRLEKDFDGAIELESSEGGFVPITGEAGRKEPKKDPLTVLIDKINDRYGTNFTEMDKVLVQMENDYAAQEKWQSYAQNNDFKTFMLLFAKDFPNMAAKRYEQNDDFFVRMFSDPDMMQQVMDTVGIPLIGVVPEDSEIRVCGSKGKPLPKNSAGFKAYDSISRRILGERVPLSINID